MKQIEIDEELVDRLRGQWAKDGLGFAVNDSDLVCSAIRELLQLDDSPIIRLALFWGQWISPTHWFLRVSVWLQTKRLKDLR
jgi:hypothetical protein